MSPKLIAPIVMPDYTLTQVTSSPTLDEFLVEQMNFKKQGGFDINEIMLTSNDHVTFDGDGCVNRGGYAGPGFNTCYRWVDPVDGNGDPANYYYGMVTVRGNPLLYGAELRHIRGMELNLSNPNPTPVHVSYMDNDYTDNSNDISDGGPHHQCDGTGPARLRVRVRHGGVAAAGPPPKLYDLVSTAFDGNGLMLNPMFFTQTVSPLGQDAAIGYPKSMAVQSEQEFYANRWYAPKGLGALTNQWPRANMDTGGWCPKTNSTVDGIHYRRNDVHSAGTYLSHVTYFPVSYVTKRPASDSDPISEHEINDHVLDGEMDFNVNIWPYPPRGRSPEFQLHGEVDGWIPLRYSWDPTTAIDSTPFWNRVWGGSPAYPNLGKKIDLLTDRRIFMTGLFNIDVFHDNDSTSSDQDWEAHPVYALAVSEVKLREFNSSVMFESWHVLVRDRGQGGYCDRDTKWFDFPRLQAGAPEFFSFDLPVDDFQRGFTVDDIQIVLQEIKLKNPAVHTITSATVAMLNDKTARLTIFFDRSKDPDNEKYFVAMGDVTVRYHWHQGYK